MTKRLKLILYWIIALIVPYAASAHLIGGKGIVSGITHPLLGIDHMLAMIAVGVISIQLGGRAIYLIPATFVSFMVLGGIIAMLGIILPSVEAGIALSVLFLGILVALQGKFPRKWAIFFVALFAIFHGHAHGEEMPLIASPALYAAGFILSTAMLHITGILSGIYASKKELGVKILKAAGMAMGVLGIFLLI